ncbi:hypothetical protein G5S89_00500 [Lactobacillus jensenii]|uniref:hypothetical protein n=1 Tax=Lactobacillus jensenii TaxID=109790 RepID=UPI0013D3AFB0|nr:hypothetical protein [Lactobacillus jensenii]NGG31516.1 hypothetical protein [Lactobacillus jensenii]
MSDSRNLIVRIKKDSQEDNRLRTQANQSESIRALIKLVGNQIGNVDLKTFLINNAIDNNSVNLFSGVDTSSDENDSEKKDKYNNLPKKTKKVASTDVNKSNKGKKDSIQDYDSLTKGLS